MRLLGALVAAALALAVTAAPAGAHATIVRTLPADTALVKAAPRVVQIRWSESIDFGDGGVRLLDATGKPVPGAAARHGRDPATAVVSVPAGLEDGTYVVAWKVTSADSHPVSGAFSFSVGTPSAVVSAEEDQAPGREVEALDAIARGVAFLGFSLAAGGACLLLLLWPGGPRPARGSRVVWAGVGLLAGGTLAALVLQAPYAGGSLAFTLSTRFGHALLARLVLTAALAWLLARALRGAGRRGPALLGLAGVVLALLATWTLADHSRTGVQVWLGLPAATVHLLAMALWLGGLAVLLACVLPRPDATVEPVVARFSRLALGCFAALGLTGVYLAWRQSGALAALPATDFGRLLLVKSAIVLAIVGLASVSRRAAGRMGEGAGRRLRRTVLAEAVLGVIVLGVTATLVNAEPARVAYSPPVEETVPGPDGGRVQLHMEPARQGENVVDLYLLARGGGLLVPPEVTARLAPPAGEDLGPLPVALTPAEPGHYVAQRLTVPFPGSWTLELSVRTSEIDEDVVKLPVRVR